ncbi:hypothetical protein ACM7UJ_31380 [Pseudomonas aeruginosa]
MGHTEAYQFFDPREGEYGLCYSKPTLEEAQQLAAEKGYSGKIHQVITAFPPKPSRREYVDGCEWQDIDEYPEIPF